MRCTRERSGAATGFESDSLTGGMGGDYTSCGRPIKAKSPNSTHAQAEVEHCRARLRESTVFAGVFSGIWQQLM
jgi:hypothetical protein